MRSCGIDLGREWVGMYDALRIGRCDTILCDVMCPMCWMKGEVGEAENGRLKEECGKQGFLVHLMRNI